MTDPVCAHGQTAAQGCVWCPKKPGGTEYETGYDRAPINREQIMLGDITDLRERVSDLERTIAEHRQNWLRNDIRNWKAIAAGLIWPAIVLAMLACFVAAKITRFKISELWEKDDEKATR